MAQFLLRTRSGPNCRTILLGEIPAQTAPDPIYPELMTELDARAHAWAVGLARYKAVLNVVLWTSAPEQGPGDTSGPELTGDKVLLDEVLGVTRQLFEVYSVSGAVVVIDRPDTW